MNKTVLGILHSANTVPLGSPIWETEAEYQKYVKIIEATINECADRAEAYAYMSPNFTALAEELRAILRKAQEK
jgi:hypothetical protein